MKRFFTPLSTLLVGVAIGYFGVPKIRAAIGK